jgi:nucleolar protein 56
VTEQRNFRSALATVNSVESCFKMVTHVLFESASGYAIFETKFTENIGSKSKDVQESFQDLAKFGKMVSLMSFLPFKNSTQALENANDISEGVCSIV